MVLDYLSAAVRLLLADEHEVDRNQTTRLRWVERLRAFDPNLLGPTRSTAAEALMRALTALREERSAAGWPGLGAVVVLTGPDRRLADEAAEGLAQGLHLPLARIGDGQLPGTYEASDGEESHRWQAHRTAAQLLVSDRFTVMGDRGTAAGQADGDSDDDDLPRGSVWHERDFAELFADLGEAAVVQLSAPADGVGRMKTFIDALAVSPHLTVLHQHRGAVPAVLRRRAAVVLPWAVVDPATRRLRREALGGVGQPPAAHDLAVLPAAAVRHNHPCLAMKPPIPIVAD